MAYLTGENRPLPSNEIDCPFCEIPKKSDEEALIVYRGASNYAVLNLYPYNPGHLLICTYRHVADLTELSESERTEMSELAATAMRVLRQVSNAAGFNLGINQGAVSGAGVAAHIHQHVIPRWSGDANFMPLIGQTKVLPKLLSESRDEIASAWAAQPK
jgi:ATP adenylyltransferase